MPRVPLARVGPLLHRVAHNIIESFKATQRLMGSSFVTTKHVDAYGRSFPPAPMAVANDSATAHDITPA
eukprot:COSAG02_NODE_1739_length_11117_cov_14.095843_6_plen_69_part_00